VYLLREGEEPLAVIEGLHTPLGLLWHDGVLYVASEERIDAKASMASSSPTFEL